MRASPCLRFTIIAAIQLALPLAAGAAPGIKYPGKVRFGNLPVAPARAVKPLWVKGPGREIALTVADFFGDGGSLSVKWIPVKEDGKPARSIQLEREGRPLASFGRVPSRGIPGGYLPVHVFDYDGNGLRDIKFVFYNGGCAGNSNNGQVYYLFQHRRNWRLLSFFIRDVSYTWECDLNGDGRYEILKGHHQDKRKPGYHDKKSDRWVSQVFRKYLFINAYSLGEKGLTLANGLSGQLPLILPFTSDPFQVARDREFMDYNQFRLPHEYLFLKAPSP
jgi:hypothetical protein